MTNNQIADYFSTLSKLMDINGDNPFKSKSYASAAFAIEKLPIQLSSIEPSTISSIKGIGDSSAKKIIEILSTKKLTQLDEILKIVPEGVVEMLRIKGIGPKKINTIWKEMGLESVGELLYACQENRLKLYKGFGEKTQLSVINGIEFYLQNKGNFLYAQVMKAADEMLNFLKKTFPDTRIFITGDYARQNEIVNKLEFVVKEKLETIAQKLSPQPSFEIKEQGTDFIEYLTAANINIKIYAALDNCIEKVIETSSSEEFYKNVSSINSSSKNTSTEEDYFTSRNLPFIPSFLRENISLLQPSTQPLSHLQPSDIKGLIHCHSNWSDGNNTIEEMALAAMDKGLEYLAISDHSKTASYAQGLREEQIVAQHQYIDELNERLFPFKIFKSIESDILGDGSLDYANNILSTFDLVIASVHSNLKMSLDKAMVRLLAAVENPYTTVLGHLTGRLLLSRPSYPLDFKKIIDACAANHVVIELNANPNRLDIDWREIKYALDKNVLISINPDSHSINGIDDIKYGVFSAQKAMLQKHQNLSSFSLPAFEEFLANRKKIRGI